MSWIIDFLMSWGYWGMLVSAFLAGSFFPFSSEVVMSGLQAAGLEPIQLVLYGSIGNVLGSMFNYGVGRMGKLEWIEKYLKVDRAKIEKMQHWLEGKGAVMAFFSFMPVVGDIIALALGYMRSNIYIVNICMFTGKFVRYVLIMYGVSWII